MITSFSKNGAYAMFVLFSLIFVHNRCLSQLAIGIEGGYYKNTLKTNIANRTSTDYVPEYGFGIGLPVHFQLNNWLGLVADPSYIQKNYSVQRSGSYSGVYEKTNNGYIQLPLMASFMVGGEKLKAFLNAGVYAGFWLTTVSKGVVINILDVSGGDSSNSNNVQFHHLYKYKQSNFFDNRKDNRLEAGWIGGLGLEYAFNNRYHVFTEGRIQYSFTDQQKKYMTNQVPRYNTTYGIVAGILYHLKKPVVHISKG